MVFLHSIQILRHPAATPESILQYSYDPVYTGFLGYTRKSDRDASLSAEMLCLTGIKWDNAESSLPHRWLCAIIGMVLVGISVICVSMRRQLTTCIIKQITRFIFNPHKDFQ